MMNIYFKKGKREIQSRQISLVNDLLEKNMQEEGRSNKERRNEIKVIKRKKECGLLAECRLSLSTSLLTL
jgi:hypothetical protein